MATIPSILEGFRTEILTERREIEMLREEWDMPEEDYPLSPPTDLRSIAFDDPEVQ